MNIVSAALSNHVGGFSTTVIEIDNSVELEKKTTFADDI